MSDVATERLAEFGRAWRDADDHYHDDVVAAHGDKSLQQQIDANWYQHQKNWADAGTAALETQSDAVDAAHEAAKTANDAVDAARQAAEDITAIIRKSTAVANALIGELQAIADA